MAHRSPPAPLAHTFSIVARDAVSGQLGVAVQSHWFGVGAGVPWALAGVGAVATQAAIERSYGPRGLDLMREGDSAPEALARLLAADSGRDLRQVAMVDAAGRVAAHTGSLCVAFAGHVLGDGFSCQGNIMTGPEVWSAMASAFESAEGDLAERMLVALEAGQGAGGDARGRQSAAMLVVEAEAKPESWQGVLVDLRVDDHPDPIVELRRLLQVHRAFTYMNQGDQQIGAGDVAAALESYRVAAALVPDMAELSFWHAVALAGLGRLDEALSLFRTVFEQEPVWADIVQRLPAAGLLPPDAELMKRITDLPRAASGSSCAE
ncbi:MAG: hypothetical protein BWY79_00264 [Actinobacteria bacterium ADurb.Bin444]|nr:MAG: hypothetical protein BWY79_00264 [Actinobacteria bacterium ADurb.Bin444]